MPQTTVAKFTNFTDLPDDQAQSVVDKVRQLIIQGESDRQVDVSKAEESIALWKNQMWSEADITYFEEKFNVSPYQIPAARAPLNRLVAQQRGSRYEFGISPTDPMSYDRQRKGRDEYIEKYGHEFETEEQAGEYYDRYYDDEFAQTIEVQYSNIRKKKKTKYVESQCFENMLITGLDFLKTIYTRQDNPDGEIKTERRGVRQMLWDRSSVSPTLEDIEYIGEVQRLYQGDLISLFPDRKEEIEQVWETYTNFRSGITSDQHRQDWQHFYDFENDTSNSRLKVAELWFKDTEERFQLVENETEHTRLIKYGLEEEEIWDYVREIELDNMVASMELGELSPEFFQRSEEEVRQDIEDYVQEKYSLRTTQASVWYKCLMTHNALLEFKRDPLPHHSHPYTVAFAQFTDGWYTGLVDDVKDILLAYNKAFMFREIMLANGAKGVLLIDKGAVNKSGYTVDDIKEMWSEVGGVIDLELRGGRRLSDVFQNITTIGDGLQEIRAILNDLEAKLYAIMGVNAAMLGNVGSEAPSSQVRQAIQQGQSTNGVLFDNFNQALEVHAAEKVIPLVVAELMSKRPAAIKSISSNREQWLELNYTEEFELFAASMLDGEFQIKLQTKEPDKLISSQQSAAILELAQTRPDKISIEAALEYSDFANIGKFLRRNRELIRQDQRDQQLRQVDIQNVAQLMAEYGVDPDTAEKMMNDLRKQRASELKQQQGQAKQAAQGSPTIKRMAAENTRQGDIEQAAIQ